MAVQLHPGDHIQVRRRNGIYHHAIVDEAGWVIHFGDVRPDKARGTIRKDTVQIFSSGDRIEVVRYGRCFNPPEVVRRARSRLNEGEYHLIFKNCEHFAVWCKIGVQRSVQVERTVTALGGVSGSVGARSAALAAVGVAAAPGLGGGAQLMSGLAGLGGNAIGGAAIVAAAPAAVATTAMHHAFRDESHLSHEERHARRNARTASTSGAVSGTAASLALVGLAGIPGYSAVGITTGLAALGGTMAGGLMVVALIPVGAAVLAGVLAYKKRKDVIN